MAKRVAGINLEIGGNTAGLNKAFESTDRQLRKTANELKEVERYLKLDPTNTELLAQKEKLLAQQVGLTSDKMELLKKSQEAAEQAIKEGTEISEEQYRKLQREIVATGKNLEDLEKKQKVSTEKIDGVMKGLLTGAAAAGAGLVAMATKAGAAADDINTLAKQTGLSTEQIQIFQYASDRIDVSIDTLTGSMAKLTKNMESARNGSKNQKAAFDALGVSITNNDGKLRNNQEVMNECINALAAMENETQRDAYAMQIFGKSAQDLNPLILGGSDALKQFGEEAKAAGLILDQETLDAANEFNDSIDKLKATATGAFAKIGSEVAKQLIPMVEPLAGYIEKFVMWFTEHQTELITAITAITAALVGFNIVSTIQKGIKAFQEWKTATESVTVAQTLLNAVMAMNPIGLIVAAIAGLVAAFVVLWNKCDAFRNFWIEAWNKIKEIFTTVANFIKDNWKELTTFLVNPVAGAIALLYKLNPKFKEWVDGLVARIKEWFSGMKDIGANIISGIWNGIGDKVEWLKGKVMGVVDKIKSWFTGKDGFDTHSPSKWSEGVTENVMEGGAIGFSKVRKVLNAVKSSVGKIKNTFSSEMSSSRLNVLSTSVENSSSSGNGKSKIYPNVTNNYYGYKGTISENNAAMKKTLRNMEVSLA